MNAHLLPSLLAILPSPGAADVVTVQADDTVIERSCTVEIAPAPIADANGDGVIHIRGNDLVVDFAGARLAGSAPGAPPDTFTGTGVRVAGRNVTIQGLVVSGYKVGIHAEEADGLVIERCDVSDNFAQRLYSTPEAEDARDWLWPHANDGEEWTQNYGAGIHVRRSAGITVRDCRARRTQNGLILDRVEGAKVYDNDFSFLSGWGLAMWRSNNNVVSRNQFDFCIRGYSHGVYNRGQDSAGILMFEQCSNNTIAQNSATRCGDGFFGFAGREALGEHPAPTPDFDYQRRGNCDNLLIMNDFSYCAAHGIEMTFSFGNRFIENRLWNNAICGLWGGYSKASYITRNQIGRNGDMGYGLERGGVNIEHGRGSLIQDNVFVENACGVHLWWDADDSTMALPWAEANGHWCEDNYIQKNIFRRDKVAIQLRDAKKTTISANTMDGVGQVLEADATSEIATETVLPNTDRPEFPAFGAKQPLKKRDHLGDRKFIVMTEWGPYDHENPFLQVLPPAGDDHVYRLLGPTPIGEVTSTGEVAVRVEKPDRDAPRIVVTPAGTADYLPYELTVKVEGGAVPQAGAFLRTRWDVRAFAWRTDPREDAAAWRAEAKESVAFPAARLDLPFAGGGPSQLPGLDPAVAAAALPVDRFGILAETTVSLPAGAWRVETTSDDGIRVWVDGTLVVDDWTHHAPRRHDADLEFAAPGSHTLRVEHFELDGHSELRVALSPRR
ncbi:MAG: right-handed parallel beta-helix repeat-containing protein [Planctomycetota bacterium]